MAGLGMTDREVEAVLVGREWSEEGARFLAAHKDTHPVRRLLRKVVGAAVPLVRPPRARRKASISPALRKQVFERDAYRCVRCDGWIDLSIDHVVPESKGGPTTLENLQTMCLPCNMKKGARHAE